MPKHTEDIIEAIRQDFVQGILDGSERRYPTIEELAKKYEIPSVTLYRKSTSQSWKQQKMDFQKNLQVEIDSKRQNKLAKDAVDFDENNLRIAKAFFIGFKRSKAVFY